MASACLCCDDCLSSCFSSLCIWQIWIFFYILSWIVVSYTITHELFVEQPVESALSPYTCLLVSTDIQVHMLPVLSLLAVADNLAQI